MDLYCVQGKALSYALYVLIIRAIRFLTSWGGLLETSVTFGFVYGLLAEQVSRCQNNHQSPFRTKKYQTNRGSERDCYNAERYFEDRKSCIEVFYERKWKLPRNRISDKTFYILEMVLCLVLCGKNETKEVGQSYSSETVDHNKRTK